MSNGIPLDQFWEKDDGERMDGLICIERFIKSQGTKSAQIWGAWYDIKQLVKAALKYNGEPNEQQEACIVRGTIKIKPVNCLDEKCTGGTMCY